MVLWIPEDGTISPAHAFSNVVPFFRMHFKNLFISYIFWLNREQRKRLLPHWTAFWDGNIIFFNIQRQQCVINSIPIFLYNNYISVILKTDISGQSLEFTSIFLTRNLLHSQGVALTPAVFTVKIYRAEDLPQSKKN